MKYSAIYYHENKIKNARRRLDPKCVIVRGVATKESAIDGVHQREVLKSRVAGEQRLAVRRERERLEVDRRHRPAPHNLAGWEVINFAQNVKLVENLVINETKNIISIARTKNPVIR